MKNSLSWLFVPQIEDGGMEIFMKKRIFAMFLCVSMVSMSPIAYAKTTMTTTAGVLRKAGDIAPGWKKDDTGWYYKDNSGTNLRDGWHQIDGEWYYFNADGYILISTWVQSDSLWYYLDDSGKMARNRWVEKEYYVGDDGAMLTNTTTPDGYKVGEDGKWIQTHTISIEYRDGNKGDFQRAAKDYTLKNDSQ